MGRRSTKSSNWLSYDRAFLLTLGLLVLAVSVLIWHKQGDKSSEWPTFGWLLFGGMIVFGAVLSLVALIASPKTVYKWAGGASTHEAALIVMIIAAPVYFVLRLFSKKK